MIELKGKTKRIGIRLHPKIALTVLIAVFLLGSATGVERTIISLYAQKYVALSVQLGAVISAFGALKATMDIPSGIISDKIGRKKALTIGSITYILGAFMLAYSNSYLEILVANCLVGAGAGMFLAAAMISLSDIGSYEERAFSFGLMEFSVYAGLSAGALVAGILATIYQSLRKPLLFTAGTALIVLAISTIFIKETKSFIEEKEYNLRYKSSSKRNLSKFAKNPRLLTIYLTAHVTKIGDSLIWVFLPIYLAKTAQFNIEQIGIIQGTLTIIWALSMPLSGKISDMVGRKIPCIIGLLLNATFLLLILWVRSFPAVMALIFLTGIGAGLYYPVLPAVSADVVRPELKGSALGLYRSLRDAGYFTGPLILGFIADIYNIKSAFFTTFYLLIICAGAVLIAVKETRPGWPAFEYSIKHTGLVCEAARRVELAVHAFVNEDVEAVNKLVREAKTIERKADEIKREIMLRLSMGVLEAPDRADFLRLTELVDDVAGYIVGAGRRLTLLDPKNFPREIREHFAMFSKGVTKIADLVKQAIEALRINVEEALRIVEEIEKLETDMDDHYHEISSKIIKLSDKLSTPTLLTVRDFINLIEFAIDTAEDAGDHIRMIAVKHYI
ncbi:MAG: MFS transporter [Candidatus Baldrarchaeia archaeon]